MSRFHDGWRLIRGRRTARTIMGFAAMCIAIAALALGAMAGPATAATGPAQSGLLKAAAAAPTSSVAAGYSHTCTIRTDGSLWCWGSNGNGQVGDGTNTNRTTPVRIGDATNWANIDAGTSFSCAVRT